MLDNISAKESLYNNNSACSDENNTLSNKEIDTINFNRALIT